MCFQNTEFRPGRNCLFTTAQKHVKIFVAANKKNFSRQSVPNVKFLRLKNTQPIWSYGDIFLTRAGNVREFVRITWRRKKLISENVGRNRHNCNLQYCKEVSWVIHYWVFYRLFWQGWWQESFQCQMPCDNFNKTLKIREMEFCLFVIDRSCTIFQWVPKS